MAAGAPIEHSQLAVIPGQTKVSQGNKEYTK